jgi:phenylalanyl-tRNA synthetase alpha chain
VTDEIPGGLEDSLLALERDASGLVDEAADKAELESARVALFGRRGSITALGKQLAGLSADQKRAAGKRINSLRSSLTEQLQQRSDSLDAQAQARELEGPALDYSLPAYAPEPGHPHPLASSMEEVRSILESMGFATAEGPQVEDEYHNFEALNIPADHPARDMQDTFFTKDGHLLRTHTSPVQIRIMEKSSPPVAVIAPGAVYRQDDDITHSPMFHQVEGLLVDKGVHFGHLKGVLTEFLRALFDEDLGVRFRPSYFPFTEPSAEVDISCVICSGSGTVDDSRCRVCSGTAWVEILGAGMVHPAVFEAVGYDPGVYSGFAFGVGIERVAMLRFGIADIRHFYSQDLRFLQQF